MNEIPSKKSKKILVTYASRAGSTAGVAEAIGKTLTEGGMQVEVLPMKDRITSHAPGNRPRYLPQRRSPGLESHSRMGRKHTPTTQSMKK